MTVRIGTRALSPDGRLELRTYWVGDVASWGYVYELLEEPNQAGSDRVQVCRRLHYTGDTLACEPDRLAAVIRRELRRRRDENRRRA